MLILHLRAQNKVFGHDKSATKFSDLIKFENIR